MPKQCEVYRLGTVPYQAAWKLQESLSAEISRNLRPPTLLLLQHPHVFTFGRRGDSANLLWNTTELKRRGVELVWTDRGGDVTYHGPGQLVGYPLIPLKPGGIYSGTGEQKSNSLQVGLPKADYVGYLRKLEQTLIQALARFGVPGIQIKGKTGVWVQLESNAPNAPAAKIAAIGVKVDVRGVSSHGFALNVAPDMSYWDGIVGCGLTGFPSISLEQIIDPVPSMHEAEEAVIEAFEQVFGYKMVGISAVDLPLHGSRF